MATWAEFEAEAPELADRARGFLDAHKHKTLATLRKDGSPRISGTEANIVDGELMWGSMPNALKALDLRRDGRFALHSASEDPPGWPGDAKVAGRAVEVDADDAKRALVAAQGYDSDTLGDFHLFKADLTEVVVVGMNDERNKMLVESWHEGRGVKRVER